ncbi:transposase [Cucumis melo var. makuwa]|uniref:Transposase n=1 Tax=Cucumis melo var. makuwa TaxID=1194695 RepID=A0A5A7SIM4_CUCMM|nr:transposase [Cucumis melo var. makuwa]
MVENYIVEEAIEFCSEFIAGVSFIGLNSSVIKKNSNVDTTLSASSFIRPNKEQLDQAHLYVIQNVNDVLPYVEQHMESLRKLNSGKARSKKWIQEEHNRSFSRWLSTRVALALEVAKNSITPSLRWIAHGPFPDVATYYGIINGYYYHTKRHDDIRRVQNSGVSITATTMQVSSSKDKNPVMSDMTFYGVIQEIWEIDYHQVSFILFKCDWVDNRSGVKVDELGFTMVDLKRIGHKSDSFILATQAKQVFYVQDSANPEWMPNVDTPNETDDTNSTYIRHDCEGRWVEKVCNITTIFMIHRWRITVRMKEKCFQKIIVVFKGKEGRNAYTITTCHVRYANLADELKITHDVSYRSTLWKEARKGRNNDYFDDATRDCASRIDELVTTNKNEDILTDALGSKKHGGRVRGVGGFVSQSQYFNTVKGKEKMITPQVEICHKEDDDSRCKSDKKRSNHSRSSIGSINIDLYADEDTPSNKGVEGTPCQLSIGSINNIVAVATIVEDKIGCPNVKVLVDVEHSTRKDVVYSSNYTDVNGIIKLLNRHAVNNMKDVDMIRIPMNELIFGSDKFVYLAREDLLHYCGMVEIGYMCILAYITGLKTWQAKHDLQRYRSTPKWRPVKCPRQLDSVGCGYYVQKYIHEIVHNSSTSITSLFNTKNAYRQEEIDEIRTEWATFVSRFV